ncbi:hypothetical protein ZIOFF_052141 [Zingiber officinale]|uniref:FPL domain-containing protein n=1 Tax=Zingiber officinale TaxID=94328 RepID=A0A8J5FUP9_ZINOF|nr:hypothetical protein ZIOFF_052141 [Zingiber officinale]
MIFWLLVLSFQLFVVSVENSEALLRYGSALVQGAGNVFWYDALMCYQYLWIDIETNGRIFSSLFNYLLEEVALVPERSAKISLQVLLSNFLTVRPSRSLPSPFRTSKTAHPLKDQASIASTLANTILQ